MRADDWLGMARVQRAVVGAADGARGLLLAHRRDRADRARRRRRARRQHRAPGRHHAGAARDRLRGAARNRAPSCTTSRSASPRPRRCTSARRARRVLGHAMELFGHVMLEDDLIVEPLDYAGGRVRVPDGPGLGVTLDVDALDRYATQPPVVLERSRWTRVGARDALHRRRDRDARAGAAARRGARERGRPHRRGRRRGGVSRGAARGRRRGLRATSTCAGRALLPGFIDTHLHPIMLVYFDLNADLRGVRSIAALQDAAAPPRGAICAGRVAGRAPARRTRISPSGRLPTRAELDAACADRPVVVVEHDGHSAVGNSLALAAAGIDAGTPDPPGGRIDARRDGSPLGPCFEAAAQRLLGAAPSPSLERLRESARTHLRAAPGLRHHVGGRRAPDRRRRDPPAPRAVSSRSRCSCCSTRCRSRPTRSWSGAASTRRSRRARRRSTIPPPDAASAASRSSPTAPSAAARRACTSRSRDRPGERGFLTLDDDEIFARMRAAHAAALQICVHAIGDAADRALRRALRAAARRVAARAITATASSTRRWCAPEQIARIARARALRLDAAALHPLGEGRGCTAGSAPSARAHVYPLRALIDARRAASAAPRTRRSSRSTCCTRSSAA